VTLCSRTPDILAHLPPLQTAEDCGRDADLVVPIRLPFDYPLTKYEERDEPWRCDVCFSGLVDVNGMTQEEVGGEVEESGVGNES
jgi:hypothetical protein